MNEKKEKLQFAFKVVDWNKDVVINYYPINTCAYHAKLMISMIADNIWKHLEAKRKAVWNVEIGRLAGRQVGR